MYKNNFYAFGGACVTLGLAVATLILKGMIGLSYESLLAVCLVAIFFLICLRLISLLNKPKQYRVTYYLNNRVSHKYACGTFKQLERLLTTLDVSLSKRQESIIRSGKSVEISNLNEKFIIRVR